MAEETIVFTPGREMPPDVLEQAWRMKPEGFNLQMMPGNASAADIAAAMRDAEYLVGFIRPLPDEAYTDAKQLKLVQVLSAGYDRINIEGARKARVPICQNGGTSSSWRGRRWGSLGLATLDSRWPNGSSRLIPT